MDLFEVFKKVHVHEVIGLLEGIIDPRAAVGGVVGGVVRVAVQGFLDGGLVEIVNDVVWRCGVVVWVADVVDAAVGESIV